MHSPVRLSLQTFFRAPFNANCWTGRAYPPARPDPPSLIVTGRVFCSLQAQLERRVRAWVFSASPQRDVGICLTPKKFGALLIQPSRDAGTCSTPQRCWILESVCFIPRRGWTLLSPKSILGVTSSKRDAGVSVTPKKDWGWLNPKEILDLFANPRRGLGVG